MSDKIYVESLLLMAVNEISMELIDSIPPKDEIEKIYTASKSFLKNKEAQIRKEERKDKYIKFKNITSRVAVIILMTFSLSFSTLLTAEAVRESVVTTVLEWRDKFTRIFVESEVQTDVLPEIKFNYIPEGFILIEEKTIIGSSIINYLYQNKNDDYLRIIVNSKSYNTDDYIDNEHSSYYSLKIDNNNVIWLNSKTENKIIFSYHNINFNISGKIPLEEIVQIYKNIEIL